MFDDHPDALFAMVRESEDDVADDVCHCGLYKGYREANVTTISNNANKHNGTEDLTQTTYVCPAPLGSCGYNSGVLFAHLHRWQDFNFASMIEEQITFATKHEYHMPYGDQGILNAMAGRFPERLLDL